MKLIPLKRKDAGLYITTHRNYEFRISKNPESGQWDATIHYTDKDENVHELYTASNWSKRIAQKNMNDWMLKYDPRPAIELTANLKKESKGEYRWAGMVYNKPVKFEASPLEKHPKSFQWKLIVDGQLHSAAGSTGTRLKHCQQDFYDKLEEIFKHPSKFNI